MGTVTQQLSKCAQDHGAIIETGRKVEQIRIDDGTAVGVVVRGGDEIKAKSIIVNADPFHLRDLCRDGGGFPLEFDKQLDGMMKCGTSMKVSWFKGSPAVKKV